jgi:hypothetical protein
MKLNVSPVATELDPRVGGTEAPWSVWRKAQSIRKISMSGTYDSAQALAAGSSEQESFGGRLVHLHIYIP